MDEQEVILDEAEAFGADLILIGSHGHGSFERFLFGSVSQAVALHAKCAVEIVRKVCGRDCAQSENRRRVKAVAVTKE